MTPQELVEHILNEEEPGRAQGLMNKAYARWQKGGDLENVSRDDFYSKLEDPERMAVVFGNLNYQVENGGFTQWIDNQYADAAWPYLQEYVAKYGKEFPAVAKVGQLLAKIEESFQDAGGEDKWESKYEWMEKSGDTDQLGDAIQREDWDEVDELLGGSDLNERHYRLMLDETYRNGTSVETYEDDGKWGFQLNFQDNDETVMVHDSGAIYASEEEADEAGGAFEAPPIDELDDEVAERIQDTTKNELTTEYSQHMGAFGRQQLERCDTEFYAFNKELLTELETILNRDFPDKPLDRALAALKKGWSSATTAVDKKVVQPVKQFAQRVGSAGKAAAQAFKNPPQRRESRTVDRMLGH